MTISAIHAGATAGRRIDASTSHAYTLPVVRELPRPAVELVGDRSAW